MRDLEEELQHFTKHKESHGVPKKGLEILNFIFEKKLQMLYP